MIREAVILGLLLAAAAPGALAGAEVVLVDGTRIRGESLERRDGLVLLETEGSVVSLPASLVTEIRLFEGPGEGTGSPIERSNGDDVLAPARVDAVAYAAAATGDGSRVRVPTSSDAPWRQLEAFRRDPAVFTRPTVDPRWRPSAGYDRSTDETQFSPTAWPGPRRFGWKADNSYPFEGPPSFNASEWRSAPIDDRWYPRTTWDSPARFPPLFDSGD